MRIDLTKFDKTIPHLWFAWHPVKTLDNNLVWLERVRRKKGMWIYYYKTYDGIWSAWE